MLKGTKLYSILHGKCPRCQEGYFFEERNPYNLKRFDKMYKKCPVCGEDFEREVGYYYGAMYVSYAISVAISVTTYVALNVLFDIVTWLYLVINSLLLIILIPVIYRVSRVIWINFFVHYHPPKNLSDHKTS